MNTDELRSAYLSVVGNHMEVTETPSGYVVWAPLFYSDGDGVVLSVFPDAGGWLVTDEGSTLSHLIDSGASVNGAVFTEAWSSLARPNEFIPASSTDAESIQTWTDDASLGEAIHAVAVAAIRAEGLAYVREPRNNRRRFSTTIRERMRYLAAGSLFVSRGLTRGNGEIVLASGRAKKVTETIVSEGEVIAAVQALGGHSKEGREQAHDHAFTIFSQSALPPDRRYAVISSPDTWDRSLLKEVGAVAEVVKYNQPDDLDRALAPLVNALPVKEQPAMSCV